MNVYGIEVKRSAALGAALLALAVGVVALYVAPGRWSTGWVSLAMTTREYTILLWPLALAAGAWQGRREHRAQVGELFTTTPRPRAQRMLPVLTAMGGAIALAYVLVVAAGGAKLLSPSHYFSPDFLVISAVGVLSLIAAACLGLGIGRLLPALATAPVLGVAGVLLVFFSAVTNPDWLAAVLSPMYGTGQFYGFQTIAGGVSAAVSIWMVALAVTGVVLLVAGNAKARAAAVLPVLIGLGLAMAVVPRDKNTLTAPVDPIARELVCTADAPKVCVTRVHANALGALTPVAREGLAVLAKMPGAPTEVHENATTYSLDEDEKPSDNNVVTLSLRLNRDGGLAHPEVVALEVANGLGVRGDLQCPRNPAVERAAVYYLLGREPVSDLGVIPEVTLEEPELNAEAVPLWQGLRKLPEAQALARVVAVRQSILDCQDSTGLLSRSAK